MKTVKVKVILGDDETNHRIKLVDGNHYNTVSEIKEQALNRAIVKLYGKNYAWFPDSGLKGYGVIVRECKTGGWDIVTRKISLDIDIESIPYSHLKKLFEIEHDIEKRQFDYNRGYHHALTGHECEDSDNQNYMDGYTVGELERE